MLESSSGVTIVDNPFVTLFESIDKCFDEEELKDLCFRLEHVLGTDFDNLGGQGKRGRVRELVRYCKRHGKVGTLVGTLQALRPEYEWPRFFSDSDQSSTKPKTKVQLWIEGELSDLPRERLGMLPELIATILRIAPSDISILDVRAGSIVVVLEMFVEHAVRLMTLFRRNPERLQITAHFLAVTALAVGQAEPGQVNLSGYDLMLADLHRADLRKAKLCYANLHGADLLGVDLTEANLIEIDMRRADLRSANLSRANLVEADLSGADLGGANLREADLRWARLTEANLIEADLHSADLRGANIRKANLHKAELVKANLVRANLVRVHLHQSNLQGADLHWASLHGANLAEANLSDSDLRGADLTKADLSGANLHASDLTAAIVSSEQLAVTRNLQEAILPNGVKYKPQSHTEVSRTYGSEHIVRSQTPLSGRPESSSDDRLLPRNTTSDGKGSQPDS